jgi:hypothetical protein
MADFKDLTIDEWKEIAIRMMAAKIYYEQSARKEFTGIIIRYGCEWDCISDKFKYISAAQQALQICVPKLVEVPENTAPDMFDFVISAVQVSPGSKEQPDRAKKAIEMLRKISNQLE